MSYHTSYRFIFGHTIVLEAIDDSDWYCIYKAVTLIDLIQNMASFDNTELNIHQKVEALKMLPSETLHGLKVALETTCPQLPQPIKGEDLKYEEIEFSKYTRHIHAQWLLRLVEEELFTFSPR